MSQYLYIWKNMVFSMWFLIIPAPWRFLMLNIIGSLPFNLTSFSVVNTLLTKPVPLHTENLFPFIPSPVTIPALS